MLTHLYELDCICIVFTHVCMYECSKLSETRGKLFSRNRQIFAFDFQREQLRSPLDFPILNFFSDSKIFNWCHMFMVLCELRFSFQMRDDSFNYHFILSSKSIFSRRWSFGRLSFANDGAWCKNLVCNNES